MRCDLITICRQVLFLNRTLNVPDVILIANRDSWKLNPGHIVDLHVDVFSKLEVRHALSDHVHDVDPQRRQNDSQPYKPEKRERSLLRRITLDRRVVVIVTTSVSYTTRWVLIQHM